MIYFEGIATFSKLQSVSFFALDHVKYSNCEDLSVNYPDMLSVYFGFNVKF